MSSLLLSNPVAALNPPMSGGEAQENQNAQTIPPAQESGSSGGAGTATDYSGSGAGQGGSTGSNSQQAFLSSRMTAQLANRPADATANSVIQAQASRIDEDAARTAQAEALDEALFRQLEAPDEDDRSPAFTVSKDMPDPLPTSPFLKRPSEDA